MKKENRLKKNEDFQLVFAKGKSVANRQFVLYKLEKKEQSHFRIGISVSKKLGNAVKRNYIKRCIRQAFHELEASLINHYDYVIIARQPTANLDFLQMKTSLVHVLRLAKVLSSFASKNIGEKK